MSGREESALGRVNIFWSDKNGIRQEQTVNRSTAIETEKIRRPLARL